ncbi:MAG: GTP cyclohydrolase II [Myxococcota bacterium]|jgi:GTP cyclohydrolase II
MQTVAQTRRTVDVSLGLVAEAALPSRFGTFRIVAFENAYDGKEHVAIVKGEVQGESDVLCRVHSECLTGDALGSLRCDCRDQLEHAMRRLEAEGQGIVLYMRQEGRGIGLTNKIRAYALQDQGLDTVEANLALGFQDDQRDYLICANMLELLGVVSVRLMTNNPRKVSQLRRYGAVVSERVAHELPTNPHNEHYLKTKAARSGHLLRFGEALTLVGDGSR